LEGAADFCNNICQQETTRVQKVPMELQAKKVQHADNSDWRKI
jgi:hypothetical protein